jgi:Signal transduction histidine kinase
VGLARALQNLIDNAQSHGAAPIDVSAEPTADGVLIRIRDHGPGIAETELETVRAPFAQAGKGGGVGLGLAIVERIVAHHHGRFTLVNASGGGLEARIILPQPR